MTMNIEWAITQLDAFVDLCDQHRTRYNRSGEAAYKNPNIKALHDKVIVELPIIEQIADRGWPEWRDHLIPMSSFGWDYDPLEQIAKQLLVMLRRQEELELNLGGVGPSLAVSTMHPDVWDAAKSLWRNGHFGEAVLAAAKAVNAKLQAKVGRRDLSETKLAQECFSLNAPKPGAPRLRLMKNDGSDIYTSMHAGAIAFGQGCFTGIRNVLAHEYGPQADPPEDVALHYLAAFSILARWIDQATVESVAP